jgi:hypothetical protein
MKIWTHGQENAHHECPKKCIGIEFYKVRRREESVTVVPDFSWNVFDLWNTSTLQTEFTKNLQFHESVATTVGSQ